MDPTEPHDTRDRGLIIDSVADAEVFGAVYDLHVETFLRWFGRRTGDAQTAADLTAETFAAAFASRHRFTDVGAPARAWLFTIARRQLSRYARHERVAVRHRHRLGIIPADLTPNDLERIEQLIDLEPIRGAVRQALESLPEPQAIAVRLRVGDDLPYAEVARRLGCSEGAARVRVSRGLTRLADLLENPT